MVFLMNISPIEKGYVHKNYMNFVEPIRDRKKIAQIKNQLRGQRRYRDLLLFVMGINTALRISDLLTLRVEHFLDEKQKIRPRFWIKEQKRGKRQEVVINSSIREILAEYLKQIQKSLEITPTLSSSVPRIIISKNQSNGAKLGELLQRFVTKWGCEATSAPIDCEKPGGIMFACKVWT